MSRPTISALDASTGGWVAPLNANFGKLVDTPIPIATTATTTSLNTDFEPKLYKDCVIVVVADHYLYKSNGTVWQMYRQQLTYHAPFTGGESVSTLKTDFNAILTDMIAKNWMASS